MPIGFGDEDWRGGDLWQRTCVRSLIHDIPVTSRTPRGPSGNPVCKVCGSAGRDRSSPLIFIVTRGFRPADPPPSSRRPAPGESYDRAAGDSRRARLCGGRARIGQLAVSWTGVTGSEQSPTNKTNGVDRITGAPRRQMTPRSWFMAFHVDLPTVPGITLDLRLSSPCRPALIRSLLVSRDHRSSRLSAQNTAATTDRTLATLLLL